MPDQPPKPKRPVIMLKMPCPKCKGQLEQEVLAEGGARKLPRVRCVGCKALWQSYREMVKSIPPKKMTLSDVQGALLKGKSDIRGARNVVERVRAAQTKLRRAAAAVRNIKQDGAVTEVGASLEGIVSQLIMSLDDVKEAVKGNTPDYVGEKAGVDDEGGDAETRGRGDANAN
jgi:hypothetical protein